jgi:biopolymer transport protein ExbB
MSIIDFAIKFFQDSGVAIYFSIAIMAVGLAIAIERFVFLARARAANRRAWSQMLPLLQAGRMRELAPLAQKSDAAVGKIVANALDRMHTPHRREDLDAAMEEGMMEIVPRLEKRTHYIATFANVITLVGLLGTIIGLIKGFTAVASVNPAEKAELLSKSISIAMNNTAFALAVAIPFLLIHAFLQARTSEIVDGLEAAKIGFLNLVQRHGPQASQRGDAGHRESTRDAARDSAHAESLFPATPVTPSPVSRPSRTASRTDRTPAA